MLLGYWRLLRSASDRQASRSTVRMLESLIRLAQVRPALHELPRGNSMGAGQGRGRVLC